MRIVKKCLLLLLIVFCIEQVFAIDPFTLKGERIIIPPCYKERTWKWHDHKNHLFFKNEGGYNNVYTEASLKHYSFNKDNKVNKDKEEVYGKEMFVEDVVFRDKQDEKRAVLLVVKVGEKRYVLHFPLFKVTINGKENAYDFDGFLGDVVVEQYSQKSFFKEDQYVWTLYSPHSINLLVYKLDDTKKVKGVDLTKYEGENLFINRVQRNVNGKPWQYVGVAYDLWDICKNPFHTDSFMEDECVAWKNDKHQIPLCVELKNNDDRVYVNIDSIGSLFIEETQFLEICEDRYHDSYVDEFINNYVHQNIHIESNKNKEYSYISAYYIDPKTGIGGEYLTKGDYYCDRVGLYYTIYSDSLYYSYHAVLKEVGVKGKQEKELFCPINHFKRIDIELDSVYRERIRQIELERQREREEKRLKLQQEEEKEQLQYYQMLAKKYGKANAKLIVEGEVRIGFTKEMCIEAWGEPEYINTTTTANGKIEQWVYGWFSYLYFKGNKLVTIQDQE